MKVALVNKFYPPKIGGIEYHVRVLVQELAKQPDVENINILVANEGPERTAEHVGTKTHVLRFPSWLTLQSTPIAPGLVAAIRNSDADIFHFHFPYPFGDLAWLMARQHKPYCITYHSDIVRQKFLNKLYAPIMHRFFDKASAIITTSPQLAKSSPVLCRYKDKVKIVPLGIDPQPFLAQSVQEQGSALRQSFSNKPMVLFVGRLVYYKGVHTLIRAFKDIDAELVLVGQGVLEPELRILVKELNIESKVHFIKSVSDELMPVYYNACDIFVLPSIAVTEAYGLVQLEAHASGKPVISTDLPTGVPYVNQHGVSGLVVPPGDVETLANALENLVKDEGLRKRLGRQAQKRMLESFTSEVMAEKILRIYQEIIYGNVHL